LSRHQRGKLGGLAFAGGLIGQAPALIIKPPHKERKLRAEMHRLLCGETVAQHVKHRAKAPVSDMPVVNVKLLAERFGLQLEPGTPTTGSFAPRPRILRFSEGIIASPQLVSCVTVLTARYAFTMLSTDTSMDVREKKLITIYPEKALIIKTTEIGGSRL